MQSAGFRSLALAALLGLGVWVQAVIGSAMVVHPARWPSDDATFAASGWQVSAPSKEEAWGVTHITRTYRNPSGTNATLIVSTSTEVKRVYGKGADIAFMGGGYSAAPAPARVAVSTPARRAMLVTGQDTTQLLLYSYGERRGLVGNGVLGWTMAGFDATFGYANDYYLLRLLAPVGAAGEVTPGAAEPLVALADTLFPHLATWYSTGRPAQ